jgi:quinol monooxygenase YgiN
VICVTSRFELREGAFASLMEAAREYRRATRREAGNVRCELLRSQRSPEQFQLSEAYRDGFARTQHEMAVHTRDWLQALAPLLTRPATVEQLESVLSEAVPPPLPVRERPAVESSNPFGGALIEAARAVAPPAAKRPQLTVDVETIEIASARDHLPLRAAQPCVVVGAFVIDAAGAHGIGRTVYRFTPSKALPACLVGVQRLLDVPVPLGQLPLKLAVVLMSVEENGGSDVRALYQSLADARELSFWPHHEACPAPVSLAEGGGGTLFSEPQRAQVLRGSKTLADSLEDDTWAGAALGCFELTASTPECLARFHTASEDQKNDWLLTLRCRVG